MINKEGFNYLIDCFLNCCWQRAEQIQDKDGGGTGIRKTTRGQQNQGFQQGFQLI